MPTELELHQLFFQAWKDLHALGAKKKPGGPSMEHQAAAEFLVERARAIEAYSPSVPVEKPLVQPVNAAMADYRSLSAQVAAIQPKDTRRNG